MNTPLLLLLYNRPKYTKKLISTLSYIKPKQIFISIDGPVDEFDKLKIRSVRNLIKTKITWKSKIKFKINNKNLGCRRAVSEAISWFFNHVNYGIILEDDILPSKYFFDFCSKLLIKFSKNKKISMITGFNPINSENSENLNYFASNNFPIWGWATWKDRWKKYTPNINKKNIIALYKKQKKEVGFLQAIFNYNKFVSNKYHWRDTWDIQWVFLCMNLKSYCITPQTNLVFNQDDKYFKLEKGSFNKKYKLKHTKKVKLNRQYDDLLFEKYNKNHIVRIIIKNIIGLIKEKFTFSI